MHEKLHATVQIVFLRLKVLILTNHTVRWHMMTYSVSTLLSRPCIDSLTISYLSVMNFRIKNSHSWESLCHSTTVLSRLVWKILPQCSFKLRWWSIFIQYMNGIQGGGIDWWKWNILHDTLVTMIKYNENTIEHSVYIKVFTDVTVSYITVSTDDVLDTTNKETEFPELRSVFEKNNLRWKSKKDQSLSTKISEFSSLLLVSVLIRLITSWK